MFSLIRDATSSPPSPPMSGNVYMTLNEPPSIPSSFSSQGCSGCCNKTWSPTTCKILLIIGLVLIFAGIFALLPPGPLLFGVFKVGGMLVKKLIGGLSISAGIVSLFLSCYKAPSIRESQPKLPPPPIRESQPKLPPPPILESRPKLPPSIRKARPKLAPFIREPRQTLVGTPIWGEVAPDYIEGDDAHRPQEALPVWNENIIQDMIPKREGIDDRSFPEEIGRTLMNSLVPFCEDSAEMMRELVAIITANEALFKLYKGGYYSLFDHASMLDALEKSQCSSAAKQKLTSWINGLDSLLRSAK